MPMLEHIQGPNVQDGGVLMATWQAAPAVPPDAFGRQVMAVEGLEGQRLLYRSPPDGNLPPPGETPPAAPPSRTSIAPSAVLPGTARRVPNFPPTSEASRRSRIARSAARLPRLV